MNTIPSSAPTYPLCFTGLSLDQINYHLRQGLASEADAAQMVIWWNESGKRFTIATLQRRNVTLGATTCLAPYIAITDPID